MALHIPSSKEAGFGILGLWRAGQQDVPERALSVAEQQRIARETHIGLSAVINTAFATEGFEYEGLSDFFDDEFEGADELNNIADAAGTTVSAIRYSDARPHEVAALREGIRTGAAWLISGVREDVRRRLPADTLDEQFAYWNAFNSSCNLLYVPEGAGAIVLAEAIRDLRLRPAEAPVSGY